MTDSSKPNRSIKTTETVFGIIEEISRSSGATREELSDRLGLAESTVHTHAQTLIDRGYLVKEGREYQLGLRFLEHGMAARDRYKLVGISQEALENLASKTGEAAYLITEEHGKAVYVNKALGDKSVQTEGRIGYRRHLHEIAAGKAILAELSREEVLDIVEKHGLPMKTENTITDVNELFEELDTIREHGIAVNVNESLEGEKAAAAPITTDSDVVGAVAVVGPSNRLTGELFEDTIPRLLLEAANELELRYQF
mgnify:CR=1 FL=1